MKIKGFDIGIISFFCLLAAFLFCIRFIPQTGRTNVVVTVGHEQEIYETEIDREITINAADVQIVLQIEHGRVRVKEADCKDQTCVKTGWIHRHGECIVCMPAGVFIEIRQEGETGYDAFSG